MWAGEVFGCRSQLSDQNWSRHLIKATYQGRQFLPVISFQSFTPAVIKRSQLTVKHKRQSKLALVTENLAVQTYFEQKSKNCPIVFYSICSIITVTGCPVFGVIFEPCVKKFFFRYMRLGVLRPLSDIATSIKHQCVIQYSVFTEVIEAKTEDLCLIFVT